MALSAMTISSAFACQRRCQSGASIATAALAALDGGAFAAAGAEAAAVRNFSGTA